MDSSPQIEINKLLRVLSVQLDGEANSLVIVAGSFLIRRAS